MPNLFQQPKSLEVEEILNFSLGTRVKHTDDAVTRSVIKNVAQNNWKAADIKLLFFFTAFPNNSASVPLPPASVPL